MIHIKEPNLLIVEGTHEIKFFKNLINFMSLRNIQIEQIGGDDFDPIVSTLKGFPSFPIINSIGIVRDADINCQNMFVSVQNSLQKGGLPVPNSLTEIAGEKPKVSIFVCPDNNNPGALENLCLASVEGDPILNCVDLYMDCLRHTQQTDHPHPFKARVQVYLAKEPDGDVHMGIAAERNIWKWESPALSSIRKFLLDLYS